MTKDQIVKLGPLLKAFSESDAGKFAKGALMLAFPELALVVGIGEPVLRHFVKVVSTFPEAWAQSVKQAWWSAYINEI